LNGGAHLCLIDRDKALEMIQVDKSV